MSVFEQLLDKQTKLMINIHESTIMHCLIDIYHRIIYYKRFLIILYGGFSSTQINLNITKQLEVSSQGI